MNAKDKAKKLVEKFSNQAINFPYIDTQDGQCIGSGYMTHKSAKECALIVVDDLIHEFNDVVAVQYYEEVKSEINKL